MNICTPPEIDPGSKLNWHTGQEEVWPIPSMGREQLYHGPRPIAEYLWPDDAARIVACCNALRELPTAEILKAEGDILKLAGIIAARSDLVLADPS